MVTSSVAVTWRHPPYVQQLDRTATAGISLCRPRTPFPQNSIALTAWRDSPVDIPPCRRGSHDGVQRAHNSTKSRIVAACCNSFHCVQNKLVCFALDQFQAIHCRALNHAASSLVSSLLGGQKTVPRFFAVAKLLLPYFNRINHQQACSRKIDGTSTTPGTETSRFRLRFAAIDNRPPRRRRMAVTVARSSSISSINA